MNDSFVSDENSLTKNKDSRISFSQTPKPVSNLIENKMENELF